MALPWGEIFGSLAGGGAFAPEPGSAISGMRDIHAGGIAVGSKVVGSGSAATTIPPLAVAPGATVSASSAAGSGVPAWAPYALAAAAALALFALILPRSRR